MRSILDTRVALVSSCRYPGTGGRGSVIAGQKTSEEEIMDRVANSQAKRDDMLAAALARRDVTADEASDICSCYGSHERAPRLCALWLSVLPEHRLALLNKEWAGLDLTWPWRRVFLDMFRECGFVGTLPRPQAPIAVYRGVSSRAKCLGLAWTADPWTAATFAVLKRNAGAATLGHVYVVEAAPDVILGRFTDRNEDEYVLDFDRMPRVRLHREWTLEDAQREHDRRSSG